MMTILFALTVQQHPSFDSRAKTEAILRGKSFAHYRPENEEEWRRERIEGTRNQDSDYFRVGVRGASFSFSRTTGELRTIFGYSQGASKDVQKPLVPEVLEAAGRRAAEELRPGTDRPHLIGRMIGSRYYVETRRVVYGRPVDDFIRINIDPETGRADGAFLESPIDADTFGGARILDLEALRALAWRHVRVMGDQAEVTLDEVRIAISPQAKADPEGYPVPEPYLSLARSGKGVPMFRLELEDEVHRIQGVYLDARNGATVFGYVWEPLGGTPRPAVPVPRKLTVAGRKEGGVATPWTAGPPSVKGKAVILLGGRTAFRGRFDAASGTLWIGAEGKERAYRPDVALGRALIVETASQPAPRKGE